MKKFLSGMMALLLVLALAVPGVKAEAAGDYEGKTVILHTNDVHGNVEGYAYIAGLKTAYEDEGAEVILVDAGDYSQGTIYVSVSKGATAVQMMNEVGYDVAGLGNHEFDFGYAQLVENMADANFEVLCADIFEGEDAIFSENTVYETESGVKVGFFGIDTPETQTKVNPGLISELTFAVDNFTDIAQAQVAALKEAGADIVICIAHLGVDDESAPYRSYDLYAAVEGIDFIIDGHSHTVMTEGANGEPIQSTGTKFENVGVIVIDDATKAIEANCLVEVNEETPVDEEVAAVAAALVAELDAAYGAKFAESLVDLNGDKGPGNRTEETNSGDLITDAMKWQVLKDLTDLKVAEENVVAITNGGGIRAWIYAGDVTMKDINTVLPFGNTIALVYVTGAELLETLEASTQSTPGAIGGFPQVSGIDFTIDTTKEYKANAETYPDSTYYGPESIERVTINSVNGKEFSLTDTYAVITNNFCAAGGDTYYALKAATDQFDTSIPMDEAVMAYVEEKLGGVIGEEYAAPQGRITIIEAEVVDETPVEETPAENVDAAPTDKDGAAELPKTGAAVAVFYALGSMLMASGVVVARKNRKED